MSERSKALIENILQAEYDIRPSLARKIVEATLQALENLLKKRCDRDNSAV